MVNYSNEFAEFCDSFKLDDPLKLVNFLNENISHDNTYFDISGSNKHIMQWPDLTLTKKCGNCVDLSFLVYYIYQYFKSKPFYKNYNSSIVFITCVATSKEDLSNNYNDKRLFGHAVPMISIDGEVFIINCDSYYNEKNIKIKNTTFFGSFKSFDLAAEKLFKLWNLKVTENDGHQILFKDQRYLQYCILNDNDLSVLDKYYGNSSYLQRDMLEKIAKLQKMNENIMKSINQTVKYGYSDYVTYIKLNLNRLESERHFHQTKKSIKTDAKNAYIKSKLFKINK